MGRWLSSLSLATGLTLAAIAAADEVAIGPFVELGAGTSQRGPYPETGAGPARRGRLPVHAPDAAPRPLWTLQLRQRNLAPPAIAADGTLYVAGDRGLSVIDPRGTVLWSQWVGKVSHTPTLEPSGALLLTAAERLLRVVGRRRVAEIESGLVAAGPPLRSALGHVVIGSPAGRIHVLDAVGMHLARSPVPPARHYRVAQLDGGALVVSGPPRRMAVLSPQRGRLADWTVPHDVVAGPVVGASSTIWTVGDNGTLLGQSPEGRLRARVALGPERLPAPPALGRDGLVRAGAEPPALLGLDAGGRTRFSVQLEGRPGAITLDATDAAVLVTDRGLLYVVEADGALRYRLAVHARGAPRPVLGPDGRIFIADRAGRVTAWR